jgi:sulfate/thiosulfate transport system permease protein
MSAAVPATLPPSPVPHAAPRATHDPAWMRWLLTGVALLFLAFFLALPLAAVFAEGLRKGVGAYFASFNDSDVLSAIKLTFTAAAIAVPANLVFGVAAAWCIAKFNFRGKSLLTTLIDLPFAVSPVISGLIYVLMFGLQAGLDWSVAAGARHQNHFRRTRNRTGHDLCYISVRRPGADSADAVAGER